MYLVYLLLGLFVSGTVAPSISIAAVTYAPSVRVGDWWKYGFIDCQGSCDPVRGTTLALFDVKLVSGGNIELARTATFNNGSSPRTVFYSGGIADGSGNLSSRIISGGLIAGKTIYSSASYNPVINYTVTGFYAGALRDINVLSISGSNGTIRASFDKSTGVLVDYSVSAQRVSLAEKLTETSLWSSSTWPDFIFTIDMPHQPIHNGEFRSFLISLTGINNFSGTIRLVAFVNHLGPVATLTNDAITLAKGTTSTSTLSVDANSVGDFTVTILATNNILGHSITIALMSAPAPPTEEPSSALPFFDFKADVLYGITAVIATSLYLMRLKKKQSIRVTQTPSPK